MSINDISRAHIGLTISSLTIYDGSAFEFLTRLNGAPLYSLRRKKRQLCAFRLCDHEFLLKEDVAHY